MSIATSNHFLGMKQNGLLMFVCICFNFHPTAASRKIQPRWHHDDLHLHLASRILQLAASGFGNDALAVTVHGSLETCRF